MDVAFYQIVNKGQFLEFGAHKNEIKTCTMCNKTTWNVVFTLQKIDGYYNRGSSTLSPSLHYIGFQA